VPFQELAIGRVLVDIPFGDLDLSLVQKTSGVAARSSGGFPEERWFGHGCIVDADLGGLSRDADLGGLSTRAYLKMIRVDPRPV
jgi:hypothetical protein